MQTSETNAIDIAEEGAGEAAPLQPDAPPRQRLIRRTDLAQLLDAKLVEDGEAKDAPRAPDAWLERRLRVFERQMTAMEARQEQVEKNARAAAATAEQTVKALEATVAELTARADAAEAKAKAVANELRTNLNEAVLRVQTVESVARAALAENHGAAAAPEPAPVEEAALETPEPPQTPAPDEAAAAADSEASPDQPKSYLAEVRKSVVAATAAAAADETAKSETKTARLRLGLTRYFLGSLIVLTIFATGVGVAFSKGVSDGRREAVVHPAVRARLGPVLTADTPLDRLTARAE